MAVVATITSGTVNVSRAAMLHDGPRSDIVGRSETSSKIVSQHCLGGNGSLGKSFNRRVIPPAAQALQSAESHRTTDYRSAHTDTKHADMSAVRRAYPDRRHAWPGEDDGS